MSSSIPLVLSVDLQPSDLKVVLQNTTDGPLRIWHPDNSWGGAAWSVHLAAAGSRQALVLRADKQPYTANVPRFIEVPPGGQQELRLAPGGLEWTFGEDLSALRDTLLGVRVVLNIAPSPEAAQQQVATGRAESAEVLSRPPHTWLFRARPH